MNIRVVMLFAPLMVTSMDRACFGKIVCLLSFGIFYKMVNPFIQAVLRTQHMD